MTPLQAAQRIYDSTIESLADKEVLLDIDHALQIATFCATLAQAQATEHVAMQLGNIHQALITPNADGEPIGVADLLGRQAAATERIAAALYTSDGDLHVLDALYAIVSTLENHA